MSVEVGWVGLGTRTDGAFEVGDDLLGNKTDAAVGEADGNWGAAGDLAVDHDAGRGVGLNDDAVGQKSGGGGVFEAGKAAIAQGLPDKIAHFEAGVGSIGEGNDEAVVGEGIEEFLV